MYNLNTQESSATKEMPFEIVFNIKPNFGNNKKFVDEPTEPTEPLTIEPSEPTEPLTIEPSEPTEPLTIEPSEPTEPLTIEPSEPTEPLAEQLAEPSAILPVSRITRSRLLTRNGDKFRRQQRKRFDKEVLEIVYLQFFDIISLNETKLDDSIPFSFFSDPNYTIKRKNRARDGGAIETCCPLKEIKAKKFQQGGWFDSELVASRDFCYHNYLNCKNESYLNEYREARRDFKKLNRKKMNFFWSKSSKDFNNSKEFLSFYKSSIKTRGDADFNSIPEVWAVDQVETLLFLHHLLTGSWVYILRDCFSPLVPLGKPAIIDAIFSFLVQRFPIQSSIDFLSGPVATLTIVGFLTNKMNGRFSTILIIPDLFCIRVSSKPLYTSFCMLQIVNAFETGSNSSLLTSLYCTGRPPKWSSSSTAFMAAVAISSNV
ncbi:cell surface [Brachionus plicatilis]|uniref:Cell surface n=1 Tax=Brachionus plicatilis TaxID=10195 RepID=A0A3M7S397_BRAPC|nr:cell surface [Brachionus plicatilis]